ncbi:hypothetical protein AB0L68_30870 [Streptomyces sp. NPDC052164]|uniref:hypothetical protein n=1 Tax=Streptomyces sp. NPDC052164 TaxID=3155529 RepID=UPI00343D41C9
MAISLLIDQGGARNEFRPGGINDEMLRAMDTAKRHALQKDLRALAANIRADAEGRYDSVEPGWQAGVEWTLLWIENTTSQLTKDRP